MIKEKEYLGYVYDIHDCGTDCNQWGFVIYCPYSSNEIFNSECDFTYFDEADKEAKKKIDELCQHATNDVVCPHYIIDLGIEICELVATFTERCNNCPNLELNNYEQLYFMFTRTELELLTLPQLKVLCQRYGLKPTGNPGYKDPYLTTLLAFPALALNLFFCLYMFLITVSNSPSITSSN